jgi:ABC-type amino acid transport substrate-binding protein
VLRIGLLVLSGLAAALVSFAPPAVAEHQMPTVFATSWGETLALDGTGFYNEIAHDILTYTKGPEAYHVMPYRRAKAKFFAAPDSCIYPSSLSALVKAGQITDPENYSESNGLFIARTHLFVRAGQIPPKSFADIAGKIIAYPNGSTVQELLEGKGAEVLLGVTNEEDKAQMLRTGRVDMISGMIPDTAIVFARMGGPAPVYDATFALAEVPITIVCHKSKFNRHFLKTVNDALAVLAIQPAYKARMEAANLVSKTMDEASKDQISEAERKLGDIAPAADGHTPHGKGKSSRNSRSGRRLPIFQYR